MLNKNDPLIRVVQEVMKKNQAERDAAKLVNEYFGIQDRKVLPHERQGEWNAAYQTVLTEGAEALDEMMIKVNMKHGADHSRLEAKHNVKIVKPEDPKGKHIIQGSKENLRKFADNVYDNYSPVNIHPELYKDEKPLKEASLAGLAPPFEKTTRKDVLVGRGVLKKHPTQPGKHVLAKKKQMEEAAGIQQPAPTATTNRPDRPSMGTQIGSTMRNSPVAGHAKQMMANQRPKPMMANQRAAGIQRPAPTATTNRPDRPSMGTQIGSTMRNSPVAGNARQMMANQRAKQMQEGDTTSPSAMGIKKPDYATGTPAYAKSKEQTVNRTDKTSLPPGTVAKSIK